MLKLSEMQLAQLDDLEKLQYVGEVGKMIITEYPELADDGTLKTRLERAYRDAVELGFSEGPAITQFLYYEAFAPSFYRQAAITSWLTKPGQPIEQRFYDLIVQMRSRLKEF